MFLRDWRRNEPTKMDPRLLDLVWEAYRSVGARDYIHVVSAYRSPATNSMLRKPLARASPTRASTCSARRWTSTFPASA